MGSVVAEETNDLCVLIMRPLGFICSWTLGDENQSYSLEVKVK